MSTPSAAQPAAPPEIAPNKRLIATIGVILALAMTSVDLSVVGAAMPKIAADLSGLSLYSWVGVTYAVAAAVVLPVAGKLGDQFGRKPFLLTGLVGFLGASFVCGASGTMTMLIVFRGVQGLFAGILMANIYTVVGDIYSAERRIQMQGVFFSVTGLSMVIGPPLGGFITDHWKWRWIFYINVPIILLAALLILAGVPFVKSSYSWRDIDFAGVGLLVAGLVPMLIGLSITGDGHSWTSPEVLLLLIGGAAVLGAFFLVETRAAKHPIVPFPLFRTNQFAVMAVVAFFSAFAMMGTIFYVPLLMQGVLGRSATYAGSLLSPMMFALMIVPPLAGKALAAVAKYRYLGTFGYVCMVSGLYLLSTVKVTSGGGIPIVAMVLVGIGIGVTFPMATSVTQSAVPMNMLGVATSQIQFWRMIAGPVSLAVLGSIMGARISGAIGSGKSVAPVVLASALHRMFLIDAAVVAIGLVASLLLKEVPLRAMPSMRPAKPAKQQPVPEQA
jgi:EmrB/QacA subfamily drug resistance transporter